VADLEYAPERWLVRGAHDHLPAIAMDVWVNRDGG
jgi:hypothetical protein